jgi:hypothetical protein
MNAAEKIKKEINGAAEELKPSDGDESTGAASSTAVKQVDWSPENEKIVVEWCDIAKCYKWLHTRAHQKYAYMHAWFTIPAIIFSTISGTASFAQTSLPVSTQAFAPMVIGSVNILIGILTTIQQYLKISEYNESHRVSAIAWDKFARNIRIELAKHPDERTLDAGHFLKTYREEFDRLMETSPSIPDSVTQEFLQIFSGLPVKYCCCLYKGKTKDYKEKKKIEDKKKYTDFDILKKPDVCNIIVSSDGERHPWYKETEKEKNMELINSVVSEKINQIEDNVRAENEMRRKTEEIMTLRQAEKERAYKEKQMTEKQMNDHKQQQQYKIVDFIGKFIESYERTPQNYEITGALKYDIEADILDEYLKTYDHKTYKRVNVLNIV